MVVNNFYNRFQQTECTTIFKPLSIDVALLIFRRLNVPDLVKCSRASKELYRLTSDDRVWKPFTSLPFFVSKNSLHANDPILTSCFKIAVVKRVVELTKWIIASEVMIHNEDKEWINLVDTALQIELELGIHANNKKFKIKINESELQMAKWFTILTCGIKSHIYFRRIGLSKWDNLFKYADFIEKVFKEKYPWLEIATEYVRLTDYKNALTIIDKHIDKKNYLQQLEKYCFDIIDQCRKDGNFKQADVFLNELKTVAGQKATNECRNLILKNSIEAGDHSIVLSILRAGKIPANVLTNYVTLFVNKLIEKSEYDKAKEILTEFPKDLKDTSKEDIRGLLGVYVELGLIKKAWDLAHSSQEKDEFIFDILRNMFKKKGLIEEANKAELSISPWILYHFQKIDK